jgi:uncharacterized damage-inducible protein DinB
VPVDAWLRGPVPDVPPLLQPAAHALIQAMDDAGAAVSGLSAEQLWLAPHGAASVAYHLTHAAGALDRLFSYARGEQLTEEQLAALRSERETPTSPPGAEIVLNAFRDHCDAALRQLRETREDVLTEPRTVGRGALPSTVIGCLFHGAEHTARHAGQALTTAKIVRGLSARAD